MLGKVVVAGPLLLALGCSGSEGSPEDQADLDAGGTGGTSAAGRSSGGTTSVAGSGNASGMGGRGGSGGEAARGGASGGGVGGSGANGAGAGTGGSSAGAPQAGSGGVAGRGGDAGSAGAGVGGSSAGAGAGGTSSAGSAGQGTAGASAGNGGRAGAGGSGGTSTGGTSGGGSCDTSEPPANVSAWVDESFDAQLGDNLRNRRVWLLDSAIMGEGEINVCVRWGATSPVSSTVATNLAATVERWFNDWFTALGDYDCFPYPEGVSVKVTGWAVRPGQQALLANVDPSIPVYTEVDGEGEPKCPDACSYFVNPRHEFPNCPGGAENHSDYWLWFDDQLPGGGGAAAVGGDWGLRMPLATFTNNFEAESFMIVEHEMGHGFGFQDYYDWNGARPTGGSVMIVGSTSSQKPTVGDQWLLRRAWSETKALRGW